MNKFMLVILWIVMQTIGVIGTFATANMLGAM